MSSRGIFRLELAAGVALVAGLFLVSLLYIAQHRRGKLPRQVSTRNAGNGTAPQPITRQPPRESVWYLGLAAGGCATSNCHGGLKDDASPWRTSAFTFQRLDPHVQAFHVLLEKRSQEIVKRLAATENSVSEKALDPNWYLGQLEAKCIRCHATPLPGNPAFSSDANRTDIAYEHYSQGVSCEACHGPASIWRDAHLTASWETNEPEGTNSTFDKLALGFRELEKPNTAVTVCVGCHIGAGGEELNLSESQQEVTHDLIAAGHPRLDFEFSAWYAALPPHWDRTPEAQPGFYVMAWAHGQAAALKARCRLIDHQRIRMVEADGKSSSSAWPELAHFDCYSCHQGLAFPPPNHQTLELSAVSPLVVGGSWSIFAQLNQPEANRVLEWMTNTLSSALDSSAYQRPSIDLTVSEDFTTQQLLEVLAKYPDSVGKNGKALSWDELTSWYYAAAAVMRDVVKDKKDEEYRNAVLHLRCSIHRLASTMEQALVRNGDGTAGISRYASPRGISRIHLEGVPPGEDNSVQGAFFQARDAMRALQAVVASANETP